MDGAEIEDSFFVVGDAKLHSGMCKTLYLIVNKVLEIFPFIEASRPRSKSGIQALCSLHVALDKAKVLLKHCSDCSKLYLAITGDAVLMKFEKARCALQDSLRRVEDIVPQSIGSQIMEIVYELEQAIFELDEVEKQVGNDIISLLQKERQSNELEIFHQAAINLGITSSRTALTEKRALKKLIERAQKENDKRKESIVTFLSHLMRKYSKLFRSVTGDETDSQGSTPSSPTLRSSFEYVSSPIRNVHARAFDRQVSRMSYSFKSMPTPPEELRCPISLQLMCDPVIISSGQTYERACIEKWFNDGHGTCPKTQQQLAHLGLTPNYCVKGLISSWCEQHGIPIPSCPPDSLDAHYRRVSTSEVDSCMMKGAKVVPFDDKGIEEGRRNSYSCEGFEDEGLGRYVKLLSLLYECKNMRKKRRVVEEIRVLLKDDEEARIYMSANGAVEALVHFLRAAVDDGDAKTQEIGAMALFNLSLNNNRNKELLLSNSILPLLEQMISNPKTQNPATALYLTLSSLDQSKPLIASSTAIPHLVNLLHSTDPTDSINTLHNLSTHTPSIRSLLNSNIISTLHSLLMSSSSSSSIETLLTILSNIASTKEGTREIMCTIGLISCLASILDVGELPEQELIVTCIMVLCDNDERCIEMVLQEGVIPALVSVSANGSEKGREKAMKLLKMFREQREDESEVVNYEEEVVVVVGGGGGCYDGVVMVEKKSLAKARSRKFGRSISSFWKKKVSGYQC